MSPYTWLIALAVITGLKQEVEGILLLNTKVYVAFYRDICCMTVNAKLKYVN